MRDNETIYSVDTGYASAGVVVVDGEVTDAAPIFRWMIGKEWDKVRYWKKIKSIQLVENPRAIRKMSGWLCSECRRLYYEDKQAASECCSQLKTN